MPPIEMRVDGERRLRVGVPEDLLRHLGMHSGLREQRGTDVAEQFPPKTEAADDLPNRKKIRASW
jgi:hypothetical protein